MKFNGAVQMYIHFYVKKLCEKGGMRYLDKKQLYCVTSQGVKTAYSINISDANSVYLEISDLNAED